MQALLDVPRRWQSKELNEQQLSDTLTRFRLLVKENPEMGLENFILLLGPPNLSQVRAEGY